MPCRLRMATYADDAILSRATETNRIAMLICLCCLGRHGVKARRVRKRLVHGSKGAQKRNVKNKPTRNASKMCLHVLNIMTWGAHL